MLVTLMMTENMLCGHYITFCASSGEEAIEIYRRECPDMVLSDLQMPGMSGLELQQALQKEMQKTIPFMFMTADHDEDTENMGFENGAMDFIRKPFRPDVLLRHVGNILQMVDQIEGLKRHIGCVFVPKGGTDFSSLVKKADKALYEVKKNGGQFLVLLVNTIFSNLSNVADRLRKKWKEQHSDVDFEYEWSVMEP